MITFIQPSVFCTESQGIYPRDLEEQGWGQCAKLLQDTITHTMENSEMPITWTGGGNQRT